MKVSIPKYLYLEVVHLFNSLHFTSFERVSHFIFCRFSFAYAHKKKVMTRNRNNMHAKRNRQTQRKCCVSIQTMPNMNWYESLRRNANTIARFIAYEFMVFYTSFHFCLKLFRTLHAFPGKYFGKLYYLKIRFVYVRDSLWNEPVLNRFTAHDLCVFTLKCRKRTFSGMKQK